MRRTAWRSVAFVLGAALVAGGFLSQTTSPSFASAAPDKAAAWTRLWHPSFKPAPGAAIDLEAVQRLDGRFAIVGGDEHGAVVWWSDDALEWQRTGDEDTIEHGTGLAIAGGPEGYVLVGRQLSPTPRGRIWYSADGLEWTPASSKLPPGSVVWSVAVLDDGTFVAYGDGGRRDGCWMGASADGGATWDFRWQGDWTPRPAQPGGCATSVVNDEDGLLARIDLGGISESTDGITWHELVSADEVRGARPTSTRRYVDAGLVPLGDGRFALGGKGARTLVWSRQGGLERIDGPIDWSRFRPSGVALGPERSVAVRTRMPAPLVWPRADVYVDPWPRSDVVCRPKNPRIQHIIDMRPHERLECYGDRELTFDAWIPYSEYGGTCPFGAPYDWMLCWNRWLASGPGDSPGYLNFGWAPGARPKKGVNEGSAGAHVRVTGHFDDPAALQCPEPGWDGPPLEGWKSQTKADFVDDCRKQFIVTEMRRIRD